MELRTLKYFLAVAEEGNISNAAKRLHISQPTLSRQLASLEKEFGRELYTRGRDGIELSEHGIILLNYATSIVSLADKAQEDMAMPAKSVKGVVHIAAGETQVMGLIAQAMQRVRTNYPGISFEITSGTSAQLMEDLIKGFHDVMLECELKAHAKMNVMRLPRTDIWGVLMRADDELASKEAITVQDLAGRSIISSQQGWRVGVLAEWLGEYVGRLEIPVSYNLPLNSKFLVLRRTRNLRQRIEVLPYDLWI